MDLKYMQAKDREFVMEMDSHISDLQFEHRVYTKRMRSSFDERYSV